MNNEFKPDYIVTPGNVLEEYFEYYKITPEDFCQKTGISLEDINKVLYEGNSITFEMAYYFKKFFRRPIHLWLNLNKE